MRFFNLLRFFKKKPPKGRVYSTQDNWHFGDSNCTVDLQNASGDDNKSPLFKVYWGDTNQPIGPFPPFPPQG